LQAIRRSDLKAHCGLQSLEIVPKRLSPDERLIAQAPFQQFGRQTIQRFSGGSEDQRLQAAFEKLDGDAGFSIQLL
jgi:hypothetical protein